MNRHPSRIRAGWTAAVAAVVLLAVLGFFVARRGDLVRAPQTPAVAAARTADIPGTAAMRVRLDPESGGLTGAPILPQDKQQNADLAQMLDRSDRGLVQTPLSGGGYSVNLQGRFMSAEVATLGADGKPQIRCTDRPGDAAPQSAPAAPEEVK